MPDATAGRPALGVQIPLSGAFLCVCQPAFNTPKVILVSAQRQSHVEQATKSKRSWHWKQRKKPWRPKQTAAKEQLALSQASTAVVAPTATLPQVNPGARSLPQQTRLTLQ